MKKLVFAAVVSAVALMPMAAQAAIEPFSIDYSTLGVVVAPDGTQFDFNAVNAPPLAEYGVDGASYVQQQFSGGVPDGQNFSDTGFLQLHSTGTPVGDVLDGTLAGVASIVGTNDSTGLNYIYFEFVSLTGTVSGDGSSFDFDTGAAQAGTIRLVVDDDNGVTTASDGTNSTPRAPTFDGYCQDATCSTVDQSAIVLAEFQLIPVSGGSELIFDGGAFVSGTVGVTLIEGTVLNPGLFLDQFGNPFDQEALLRFIDVDATAFATDTSDLDGGGNGTANFNIANNGSLTVSAIPEPLTLGLFAVGLGLIAGAGAVTRRRDAA
jgi:hypothetical protein